MAEDKLHVYLATYEDLDQAESDWKQVRDIVRENELLLLDAAVLVRDDDGHISISKDLHHQVGRGVAIGGVIALFTPVGLLAGVLGGALAGKVAAHLHKGYSKADLRVLARGLENNGVVIVTLSEFDQQPLLNEKLTHAKDVEAATIDVDFLEFGAVFNQGQTAGGFTDKV